MTAVEFSLLALPFFLMMFAIMETSVLFLGELTLDQGVERVSRQIRVGTFAEKDEAAFRAALCKQVKSMFDCSKLRIDVRSYKNFSDISPPKLVAGGDLDASSFAYKPAGKSAVTTVRVYYKWPIVTDLMRKFLSNMKDGTHLMSSTAAFRTENF